MISYWEQTSFQSYDYLVVGGGLVGLSTAISLKEKDRNLRVAVVERGVLPSGASTKNAGFACFGSPTELYADLQTTGKDMATSILIKRWKGLEMLRERLGDAHIGFENKGGYELISEKESYILEKIPELNSLVYGLFNKVVFEEKKEVIKSFGFNQSHFKSAIYNPLEGQLNTGQLMKSLINYAQLLGISIYTGSEVSEWEESNKGISVWVESQHQKVKFVAGGMAICTNAFSKKLVPNIDLKPGRGLVLVTEPISNLPFEGTFHCDEGYYYFRDLNGRVLLGGGRNLDFETEETEAFGINDKIYEHLVQMLENQILQQKVKVDLKWSGIMAFGTNKHPIIEKISPKIAIGVRLGGMGVAMGTMVGEELSKILLSED